MKSRFTSPLLIPIALFAAVWLTAQLPAPTVSIESFRKGDAHVVEESFDARLTTQDPIYREPVKDSRGVDRYAFSIIPRVPEGDNKITSWQVKLADLHHPAYDNVLMATQYPSDDLKNDLKNSLWRLDASPLAVIPAGARRIIKVENFYVVLQVKAYHFTPLDSPYLDSMTVAVEFRNTDPGQTDPRQADPRQAQPPAK
jgi:hypothetical protein